MPWCIPSCLPVPWSPDRPTHLDAVVFGSDRNVAHPLIPPQGAHELDRSSTRLQVLMIGVLVAAAEAVGRLRPEQGEARRLVDTVADVLSELVVLGLLAVVVAAAPIRGELHPDAAAAGAVGPAGVGGHGSRRDASDGGTHRTALGQGLRIGKTGDGRRRQRTGFLSKAKKRTQYYGKSFAGLIYIF